MTSGTQELETMAAPANVAVKMDRELVEDAKVVARVNKETLAAYLNRVLRPIVKKDLDRAAKIIQQRSQRGAED